MSWMLSNKEATLFLDPCQHLRERTSPPLFLHLHQLCLSLLTQKAALFQPRWSLKIPSLAGQQGDTMATLFPTFRAGPFSLALSLARFPSSPSCTNSSSRFMSNSSTRCSSWMLAAMLARALITAREQCLGRGREMTATTRQGPPPPATSAWGL